MAQSSPYDPRHPEHPDPARAYERARPEDEPGMGRLDNNEAVPADDPDRMPDAVKNRHRLRQVNAEEMPPGRSPASALPPPAHPDHSMHDEEPLSEDTMPTDIHDMQMRRHPRTEGKGGTP